MILSMSNIAWSPEARLAHYALLAEAGLTGLEIAPGLFLPEAADPFRPDGPILEAAVREASDHGLRIVSMQSLLFGAGDAALFGDAAARDRLKERMARAIELAGRLGIENLVFGSPRQRVRPDDLLPEAAADIARAVFHRLADHARAAGTAIGLEPNPARYGTNFLNTTDETAAFVRSVGHPALGLTLDLGAMHVNGEFAAGDALIGRHVDLIRHVHVSEPGLGPAPARAEDAAQALSALRRGGYRGAVSIEMTVPDGGPETVAACLSRFRDAAAQEGVAR